MKNTNNSRLHYILDYAKWKSRIKLTKPCDGIMIFFMILFVSNTAQICFNAKLSYWILLGYASVFFFRKKKLDKIFWILTIYWFIINIIVTFHQGTYFRFNAVFGYLSTLYMAYFALKSIGPSFWNKIESWIFVLTCTSLCFYVVQLIIPSSMPYLSRFFDGYMAEPYLERYPGSWYCFLYTYQPSLDFLYVRNAGFMWEPGAFAMVCVFALFCEIAKNGMSVTKKKIIYIVAIITTFSTAGYLALGILLSYYVLKIKNLFIKILTIGSFIPLVLFVAELEFMTEKILSFGNFEPSYNTRFESIEYDRLSLFYISIARLLEFPIGYGIEQIKDFYNQSFVGVNGLAVFFRSWGILAIPGYFMLMYKTIHEKISSYWLTLAILAMLTIVFFSNPVERSPILFILMLYPMILKKY